MASKRMIETIRKYGIIAPFSSENIAGYIDTFDLKDKSLLTASYTGDSALNAISVGCKDVTIAYPRPVDKYYQYLKYAGILTLTRDEYLEFFSMYKKDDLAKAWEKEPLWDKFIASIIKTKDGKRLPDNIVLEVLLSLPDLPRFNYLYKKLKTGDNNRKFNKKSFDKMKPVLKALSEEAYDYFYMLFDEFSPREINNNLFDYFGQLDENNLIKANRYLSSLIAYDETKEKVKDVIPTFMKEEDITSESSKKYDNIWLPYDDESIDFVERLEKVAKNLQEDGKILASYVKYYIRNPEFYCWIEELKESGFTCCVEEIEPSLVPDRKNIHNQNDSILVLTKKKH